MNKYYAEHTMVAVFGSKGWIVRRDGERSLACALFADGTHPDPEAAAKLEAKRLNAELEKKSYIVQMGLGFVEVLGPMAKDCSRHRYASFDTRVSNAAGRAETLCNELNEALDEAGKNGFSND